MRIIITFFSHSTYAATHLASLRVILAIHKGLETVGKTRFATIYWAAYALLRCLPAIMQLINSGVISTSGDEVGTSCLANFSTEQHLRNALNLFFSSSSLSTRSSH
jgi:hypothetical protein